MQVVRADLRRLSGFSKVCPSEATTRHNGLMSRISRLVCALIVATLLASGCSGSGGSKSAASTTSIKFSANPLAPGQGYVQLGGSRSTFSDVICATGRAKGDPSYATRVLGVYANFRLDGTLYAVSVTRYESHPAGAAPTITETALVEMQGEGEVKGARAQRAQVVGSNNWIDVHDPSASGPLITKNGDRYTATGTFGAPDNLSESQVANVQGEIAARCPGEESPGTKTTSIPSVSPTTVVGTMAPATTAK